MRSLQIFCAVTFAATALVYSQEAEPAKKEPVEPAAGEKAAAAEEKPALELSLDPGTSKSNSTPADDVGLIPEAPIPVEKPKGSAIKQPKASRKESQDRTTAAEDEMAERIRLRQLQTKFSRDPKVVAYRDAAETAKTDLEKREALKAYYKALYDKIEKSDSSLKKRVAPLRARLIHRLEQTKVDPTQPIDPSERPETYERPPEQ